METVGEVDQLVDQREETNVRTIWLSRDGPRGFRHTRGGKLGSVMKTKTSRTADSC